jgi:hypothetical protein
MDDGGHGLAELLQEIKTTRENLNRTDEQRLAVLNDIKSEQTAMRGSIDELYKRTGRSFVAHSCPGRVRRHVRADANSERAKLDVARKPGHRGERSRAACDGRRHDALLKHVLFGYHIV